MRILLRDKGGNLTIVVPIKVSYIFGISFTGKKHMICVQSAASSFVKAFDLDLGSKENCEKTIMQIWNNNEDIDLTEYECCGEH